MTGVSTPRSRSAVGGPREAESLRNVGLQMLSARQKTAHGSKIDALGSVHESCLHGAPTPEFRGLALAQAALDRERTNQCQRYGGGFLCRNFLLSTYHEHAYRKRSDFGVQRCRPDQKN